MRSTVQHSRTRRGQGGFTILELTIATAVFSVVILVMAVGILSFSRGFFKATNQTQTQQTARSVIDELGQNVQFSKSIEGGDPVGAWNVICIDNLRYSYRINQRFNASDAGSHALIRSPLAGPCEPDSVLNAATDTELLGQNMRLTNFVTTATGDSTYRVAIGIIYGEFDLISYARADGSPVGTITDAALNSSVDIAGSSCKGGAGSQYCAQSRLDTIVQKRL